MTSLYYCRCSVSFLMDLDTFFATDLPEDLKTVPVVTYVVFVLCAVMTSECISTFGVGISIVIKIGVRTIVVSKSGRDA